MNVDKLREKLDVNLGRVDNLIRQYVAARGGGSGRTKVEHQDLLRASVVFAHASLESLTRGLLSDRLRRVPAPPALAGLLASSGSKRGEKIGWSFLLDRRGSTVDAIVDEAIQSYLDRFNLNHPGDLVNALQTSGLTNTAPIMDGMRSAIEALMKRRHWIVHQLDVNASLGRGQFVAQTISLATAERFRDTVREVGDRVLSAAEAEL